MFKVQDKTTEEIFTVYGLYGSHFLIFDEAHDWWLFKNIDECRPVADDPSSEEFPKLYIPEGEKQ